MQDARNIFLGFLFVCFDSFEKRRLFLCSFPNRFLRIQNSKSKRLFEIERREKQTGWSEQIQHKLKANWTKQVKL